MRKFLRPWVRKHDNKHKLKKTKNKKFDKLDFIKI